MKIVYFWLLAVTLLFAMSDSAEAVIRQEQVQFNQGASETQIKGRIKGRETVDYTVRARPGHVLSVTFKRRNRSAYFNILPPGSEEAIFIGSSSGDSFKAKMAIDGLYTIRVYLMRNAARRNETAPYTLQVGMMDAEPDITFDRTLEMQGIRFKVTCENIGSLNKVSIAPSGLEIDNSPVERMVEGTVTGAEVADLNADGSPEIYVYVTSAGSGSYGSLVAFSANHRKSLGEIYLLPITENQTASKGYRGHDEFAVLEGVLGHRFPVYRDTDTNAQAGGGMRQLQYKLFPGESGWVLKLDRTVEF